MKVTVLYETGHDEALRGMFLSFKDRATDTDAYWQEKRNKAYRLADTQAHKHGGHNKFLQCIPVTLEVEAPRCWWSEADTYLVGAVRQSESTMHTLLKRPPELADFEVHTSKRIMAAFIEDWHDSTYMPTKERLRFLKCSLPEGYLQRRTFHTNYKTLQNMIAQRCDHRLSYWQNFCDAVLSQVKYPQWLVKNEPNHQTTHA